MAEEKIVKVNLRKRLKSIPRWRRRAVFSRVLRKKLKDEKMKISQSLNEKIWSLKGSEIRIRVVKDEKSARAESVES